MTTDEDTTAALIARLRFDLDNFTKEVERAAYRNGYLDGHHDGIRDAENAP